MRMLPFTYPWIVRKLLTGKVLDVGCGNGDFFAQVNFDKIYEAVGVELFDPYIDAARRVGAYKKIIKKDVRKIDFPELSFDTVLCSQVIEHVTKKEGDALIILMEKIATKRIIIGTPNGHYHQESYDGNHLQEHKSHWSVADFQKKGYHVYGQGLKYIYGEEGLLQKYGNNLVIKYMLFLLSYITGPIIYFFPTLSAQLIAVKIL